MYYVGDNIKKEKNCMLTENQAMKIRVKLTKQKSNITMLAEQLKLSRPILSEIINRKRNDNGIENKLLNWLKEK